MRAKQREIDVENKYINISYFLLYVYRVAYWLELKKKKKKEEKKQTITFFAPPLLLALARVVILSHKDEKKNLIKQLGISNNDNTF